MALTKKHKTYGAVVVAGALALLVDRVFLDSGQTTPNAATAEVLEAPPLAGAAPAEPAPVAPVSPAPIPSQDESVAARLQAAIGAKVVDPSSVRDAFCPAPAWIAEPKAATPVVEPVESRAERFQRSHHLQAVMVGDLGSYAIIDGRCVFVGQMLDGFKLVCVGQASATLAAEGARVTLKLKSDVGL